MSLYNSREDENFFAAIGRLALAWGHLEFGLDCMVQILYHCCNGKAIEPEVPRALQRKITFLRAMFKSLPIEKMAIQGYLKLLDQIQTAAQIRHDIIHGAVVEHADRSEQAKLVRAIRNKGGISKREFHATTHNVLEAAQDANVLGGKVLRWTVEIYDLIDELSRRCEAKK